MKKKTSKKLIPQKVKPTHKIWWHGKSGWDNMTSGEVFSNKNELIRWLRKVIRKPCEIDIYDKEG